MKKLNKKLNLIKKYKKIRFISLIGFILTLIDIFLFIGLISVLFLQPVNAYLHIACFNIGIQGIGFIGKRIDKKSKNEKRELQSICEDNLFEPNNVIFDLEVIPKNLIIYDYSAKIPVTTKNKGYYFILSDDSQFKLLRIYKDKERNREIIEELDLVEDDAIIKGDKIMKSLKIEDKDLAERLLEYQKYLKYISTKNNDKCESINEEKVLRLGQ